MQYFTSYVQGKGTSLRGDILSRRGNPVNGFLFVYGQKMSVHKALYRYQIVFVLC